MSRLARFAAPPVVAVGLLLGGCPSEPSAKTPVETPTPTAAGPVETPKPPEDPADAPIELPKIEGPVAVVNGIEIPREPFLKELETTMKRYQRARHPVKPELAERLKDNLVRRLVDAEIIRQQAKVLKVEVTPEELAEKWTAHKSRYGSAEAFESFLTRAETTEANVKEQFEVNLVREKVFAAVSDGVEVSTAEVKEFFKENEKRYYEPEQVRASHILIRVDPKADGIVKAQKKELASDIRKKALLPKANFDALAKQYGEDPTRDRGGDLGFFTKGRMVKPFEDAVWPLKDNEIAPVVETNFGFHVIKKTGHKKAHQKTFKEVQDQIERAVRARKRNQAIRDALQKWKDEAKIDIRVQGDPEILKAAEKKPAMPTVDMPAIKKVPAPTTDDTPTR
jgi:peptidyl-prolyl cis-trans isomerase C